MSAGGHPANAGNQTSPLAASMTPFLQNHTVSGAVMLVASKDHTLAVEAVGYADIAAKRPMRPDTLFWIASMNKAMTAAALMMLVDQGKVHLDDPVENYLPEFRGQKLAVPQDNGDVLLKKPTRPVTVRDLLSHTSGLPVDFAVVLPSEGAEDTLSLRARVLAFGLSPLHFDPGSKWEYGNGNYEAAGRIIEVVSGMPYDKFMQTHLLGPLGMTDTTFWPSQDQLHRLAKSYKPNADGTGLEEATLPLTYPLSDPRRTPNPCGGLFSTASDICRFDQMILGRGVYHGRRCLSEAAIQEMTSTQTADLLSSPGSENGYGLGFNTTRKHNAPGELATWAPFGHAGAYGTNHWIDPPHDRILVFLISQAAYPQGVDRETLFHSFMQAAEASFAKSAEQ